MKGVPALTRSYEKAQVNYVRVAGLLMSWELIGISLKQEYFGIEIKSPEALPVVLMVLVAYFGYRTIIEWLQCDIQRRNDKAAKLDFFVSHGIAVAAITILCVQAIIKVQVVDVIAKHFALLPVVAIMSIFASFVIILCFVYVFFLDKPHAKGTAPVVDKTGKANELDETARKPMRAWIKRTIAWGFASITMITICVTLLTLTARTRGRGSLITALEYGLGPVIGISLILAAFVAGFVVFIWAIVKMFQTSRH